MANSSNENRPNKRPRQTDDVQQTPENSLQERVKSIERTLRSIKIEHTRISTELCIGLLRSIPVSLKWGKNQIGAACRKSNPMIIFEEDASKTCIFDGMYIWNNYIRLNPSCMTPLLLSELLVRTNDPYGKIVPTLLQTFEQLKNDPIVLFAVVMMSPNVDRAFQVVTYFIKVTEQNIIKLCLCLTGIILRFSQMEQIADLFDRIKQQSETNPNSHVAFAQKFYNTIMFLCNAFPDDKPFQTCDLVAFLSNALAQRTGALPTLFSSPEETRNVIDEVIQMSHSIFQ